jgi:hypothetical protein
LSKFSPFLSQDCDRLAARFLLKSVNAQRSVARCALLSTLCATGETRAASRHHGAARAAPMLGHGRTREPGAALFPDAAGARATARGPDAMTASRGFRENAVSRSRRERPGASRDATSARARDERSSSSSSEWSFTARVPRDARERPDAADLPLLSRLSPFLRACRPESMRISSSSIDRVSERHPSRPRERRNRRSSPATRSPGT